MSSSHDAENVHYRKSLVLGGAIVEQVNIDQGYGRGGTPIFTGLFEPVARVALYLTDEKGLDSCFGVVLAQLR